MEPQLLTLITLGGIGLFVLGALIGMVIEEIQQERNTAFLRSTYLGIIGAHEKHIQQLSAKLNRWKPERDKKGRFLKKVKS